MELRTLGSLGSVSALTLGGGGLGQVWGKTTRTEAVATIRHAVAAGITMLDLAPSYGDAEEVVGDAFRGDLPVGVRVVTKCRLGNPSTADVYARLSDSLDSSLARLQCPSIDLFVLHGTVTASALPVEAEPRPGVPAQTSLATYRDAVVPAFMRFIAEGRIRAWGITGIQLPKGIFDEDPRPTVVQCVTNFMGTPGGTVPYDEEVPMRELIATVAGAEVGVMGVRALQAGALADFPDRELNPAEARDFKRAAGFRALADDLGASAAFLAYRYALSMANVGTVVVGVKNRRELDECLAAEATGPLSAELVGAVDACVPRV
jgi:aryl-alcohol dehydrogenase-like predicted oxidoreductase